MCTAFFICNKSANLTKTYENNKLTTCQLINENISQQIRRYDGVYETKFKDQPRESQVIMVLVHVIQLSSNYITSGEAETMGTGRDI